MASQTMSTTTALGLTLTRFVPAIAAFGFAAFLGAVTGRVAAAPFRAAHTVTLPQLLCCVAFAPAAWLIFRLWRLPPNPARPVLSLRLCAMLAALCLLAGVLIGGFVGLFAV